MIAPYPLSNENSEALEYKRLNSVGTGTQKFTALTSFHSAVTKQNSDRAPMVSFIFIK